jgi:sugar phosphate isomerase/epimerase
MKLKLACADYSFPLLPFPETMDLIKSLKIGAVDVGLFEGHKHLVPSTELSRPEKFGKRLRVMLADRGLALADVFLVAATDRENLAPNNPDPKNKRKSREVFERSLDYLNASGGRHLTQLPGVYFSGVSRKDSFDRSALELEWRAQRAAHRGIVFSVEPHLGSVVETPATALRMVRRAPSLTYALDYTHFTFAGYKDSEIESLLPHASHFHVRGAEKGRLQTPFKRNRIDFKRALRLMKAQGYKGYHAIEYVWIDWERSNECDNVSETILFRDHLISVSKAI